MNTIWIDGTFAGIYKLVQNLVSIFRINFNDQTALDQLNRWIEERSGFPNVLKSSDVRDAFAIAVNTLWFKDQWVHQFDPASTMPLPFHRLDGSTVNLPMMRQANKKIRYYQQDGISAVQLPFRHGAVAEFVLGLPVGSDISVDLPYGNEGIEVSLALPRFKHQERINLERVVEAAGLGGLFEAGSLQGMVPETSPMGKYNAGVSKFEQLIYAEFNEEGAEVRAVTYATVRTAIVMEKRIVMHFDRPFHYRIIKDGSTLLQGYYGAEKEMGVPPAAPRSPMVPAPSMYGMTTRY